MYWAVSVQGDPNLSRIGVQQPNVSECAEIIIVLPEGFESVRPYHAGESGLKGVWNFAVSVYISSRECPLAECSRPIRTLWCR
jgi:hypothetical protein